MLRSQFDKLGSEVGNKSKELNNYIHELEKKRHDHSRGNSGFKENMKITTTTTYTTKVSPISLKF